MLILVAILAAPQVLKALRYETSSGEAGYYVVSGEHKLIYSVYYLGLTGFVATMTFELHNMLGKV